MDQQGLPRPTPNALNMDGDRLSELGRIYLALGPFFGKKSLGIRTHLADRRVGHPLFRVFSFKLLEKREPAVGIGNVGSINLTQEVPNFPRGSSDLLAQVALKIM